MHTQQKIVVNKLNWLLYYFFVYILCFLQIVFEIIIIKNFIHLFIVLLAQRHNLFFNNPNNFFSIQLSQLNKCLK